MSKLSWTQQRGAVAWMLALAECAGLVACEESPCEATVHVAGKSATAAGESRQQALQKACRVHCVEHDSLLDSKHRVWKAAGGKSSGNKDTDIEQVAPLKRLRSACEERCRNEVKPESVRYKNCGS